MKKINTLLAGLILVAGFSISALSQNEASITTIRGKVGAIDKKLLKYRKEKRDVDGISIEGAVATYYHEGTLLKKITTKMYGETYKASGELYFERGQPLFFYIRLSRYDASIGLRTPLKIVSVEQQRFYFENGELIKTLIGKREIRKTDDRYAELSQQAMEISKGLEKAYHEDSSSSTDSPED